MSSFVFCFEVLISGLELGLGLLGLWGCAAGAGAGGGPGLERLGVGPGRGWGLQGGLGGWEGAVCCE